MNSQAYQKVRSLRSVWVVYVTIQLVVATPVWAVPNPWDFMVFSTGVDATGTPLATGTVDPHYVLTTDPSGSPAPKPLVSTLNPGWVANPADARWISPAGSGTQGLAFGDYVYETTFNLTGNAASAAINLNWASDNSATLFLNGAPKGNLGLTGFSALHPLTIGPNDPDFVAGINTLSVDVFNQSNVTGLLVQITNATLVPVPEPNTILLLGSGLAAVTAWRCKHAGRMRRGPLAHLVRQPFARLH